MNREQPITEDMRFVAAAARLIVDAALDIIENDPHRWSNRPCRTCRSITTLVGRDFGCVRYAETGVRPDA